MLKINCKLPLYLICYYCNNLISFARFVFFRLYKMSSSLRPYLEVVEATLNVALTLRDYSSQLVEQHNKPEVEVRSSMEMILNPVVVSRNEKEKVLIETAVNSIRISIAVKQVDDMEKFLCLKFTRFMMRRAENFLILRRVPIPGYDISFLITNSHIEEMHKHKLISFIITFMEEIDKEISDLKLSLKTRARFALDEFLKKF
ncbi:Actin-related protein 2/3 complex subunit 4 [Trichinella spiralis]|uniref:Actin-related protein 2/3 complex subunit 4 n=1 Tax=Trichinella spiralis TaxID=6334 RepID=A0A0V1BGH6_TRISP|nr:Actin-related protein 2/3 complex subunit 4 [Trichinella spiralis]